MADASSDAAASSRPRPQRRRKLVGIAVAVAVVAVTFYAIGRATGSTLVGFIGLMISATTWVPLPADTFVLAASAELPAAVVGVVGGLINATMVLVERQWVLALVDSPSFDRVRRFFAANRLVDLTERNMFVALVVGGASFVPFEPFRLVAIMRDYSPVKYFLATFIGRGGRYFVLASLGSALLDIGLLQQAIWVTLALFAFGLWRSAVRIIRGSRAMDDVPRELLADEDSDGEAGADEPDDPAGGKIDG
jgi:membrane protein YqaA with SNARE-associated domain